MRYTFEKVTTVSGFDTLLTNAQKVKQILLRKRRNLGEALERFHARLDKLTREVETTQSLLQVLGVAYNALPEGKYKLNMHVDIKRLELRRAILNKKALTCNALTLLAKQLKYNRLDVQVSAIEHYIQEVQNRKTALAEVPRTSLLVSNLRFPAVGVKLQPQKSSNTRAKSKTYAKAGSLKSPFDLTRFPIHLRRNYGSKFRERAYHNNPI